MHIVAAEIGTPALSTVHGWIFGFKQIRCFSGCDTKSDGTIRKEEEVSEEDGRLLFHLK